ncbi:hypothetical protein FNV43_RR18948 [Rhamnella rubrinervis]|uniref:Uncharacterized protein n=1 Tax=Rhamnella rubrinervis TaxID=2594499 RepID=A0A8K0GW34_9ROSA|nr:hypothetical protein FNV43_RR18948 [Rhamnella rubrinervis]
MNKRNKVDICEDFCFHCKDGGLLMVCDYRDCLKAYHPDCVGKDDSFVETGERWTCDWHSCLFCPNSAKFQCLCCPQAVCRCCIFDVDFARVRGNKGLCNHCLMLALLIDEGKDVDSDGVKVDFNDRDTYEFCFKEYLELTMVKEGLTWENFRSAANSLKKGENSKCDCDLNEISKMEENTRESEEESHLVLSDYDDSKDTEEYDPVEDKKLSKKKLVMRKGGVKSKKTEFIGWGSKTLLEFLSSIGTDTTKELSQYEVTTIVTDYCKEKKLFHPERKKRVLCNARLQSLFGRKSLSKNRIYNLLDNHFAKNFEQSEEDEFGSCSEHNEDLLAVCKRQRKLSSCKEPQKSKVTEDLRKSCFASITAENIKLVYLKRSLVEELLKHPETFSAKVMGSFVRVKSDPNDYLQRNSHQLLQVIGVSILRNSEMNDEIFLELSSLPRNVPICKLSDENFSEIQNPSVGLEFVGEVTFLIKHMEIVSSKSEA